MSDDATCLTGSISWADLTVPDAEKVRDFYQEVVGWQTQPVPMGDYDDFCMVPPGSYQPVAGVCHAQGPNAGLPPHWIIYINVADLDQSLEACQKGGGEIILGPKDFGPEARYAVVKDPAGAAVGLFCKTGEDSK